MLQKIQEIVKILTEEHNFINLFWINFHKVDTNVYRSAQLTPWNLKKIIKQYNIKTIINLRGKKNYLYKVEEQICNEMGVNYILFPISSRKLADYETLKKLKTILLESEKPLLFHCKAGADRTGFTATFYHILNGKTAKEAVEKELKLKYGYLSLSKAGRVKQFFLNYDNKTDFIEWAKTNRDKIQNNFTETPFIDFIYEKILRRE